MPKLDYEENVKGKITNLERLEFKEPTYFPYLSDGQVIFCIVKFRDVEKKVVYVCHTYHDMSVLYHDTHRFAEEIVWYRGCLLANKS